MTRQLDCIVFGNDEKFLLCTMNKMVIHVLKIQLKISFNWSRHYTLHAHIIHTHIARFTILQSVSTKIIKWSISLLCFVSSLRIQKRYFSDCRVCHHQHHPNKIGYDFCNAACRCKVRTCTVLPKQST